MALDAWLPVNYPLPDGQITRRAVYEGSDWQVFETRTGHALLTRPLLAERWITCGLVEVAQVPAISVAGQTLHVLTTSGASAIMPLACCPAPESAMQSRRFAEVFRASRALAGDASLQDALYVEGSRRLLPTYALTPAVADDLVFGRWLTGGVSVSVYALRRLLALTSWMGEAHLRDTLSLAGFTISANAADDPADEAVERTAEDPHPATRIRTTRPARDLANTGGAPFNLAGRPALSQFLIEHVIDIIEQPARYRALNINFPSALILHGPPGCGKTFAIERLVDYLGWPCFQIDAASVASPYIHATSKKIAEVFDQAIATAPAVVVMDEMEAFLSDRQMGSGSSMHRVEEVAEFLRRIPEAIKHRVLIVGMTNRIDMIDPAILRRGRFDHVVKVDMASHEEVITLLEQLLGELPCTDDIDFVALAAQLQGRPLSDVAFVVREAARLAARARQSVISASLLATAVAATPSRIDDEAVPTRKIGFT